MTPSITPAQTRQALTHLSANVSRDEWVKMGMAIHSEFPDDTGLDLFIEWSATGEDYDPKAAVSTWKGFKSGGGVGIATLIYEAKRNGFTMPKEGHAQSVPDPLALAQQARDKAARQLAESARIDAAQASAATEAVSLWEQASTTGTSAYLTRKGVQPHGVRFDADGRVLVPMRDASGKLWNIQHIAPNPPASGGTDKLFLKGGVKSGLWHMLGADTGASDGGGSDPAGPAVVLVGEGFATAATLYEATNHPVAVAFDAGNLPKVAKALRKLYPAALLVLCGDDDLQTFARTGKNPGRDSATEAARAVRGIAVFPAPLAEGASDFNDLHRAMGLDAVRAIVDKAIDAHRAKQQAAQARESARTRATKPNKMTTSNSNTNSPNGMPHNPSGANVATSSAPKRDYFHVDDDGVWFHPPGDDDAKPRMVCGPLWVTGLARDANDHQAALLLEFDTPFSKGRKWLMPLAMLSGDGAAYRSALLSQGFMAPTDSKRRALMTEYLQSRAPAELVLHVPRVGWHDNCYVLPEETLGTNTTGDHVIFHSESGLEANFSKRGNLGEWRQNLARVCVGNSRMTLAVCTAFAGPLLAFAPGVSGGGFHFVGATSIGKTTGFLVAASVYGKGTEREAKSFIQKWKGTSNGLEGLCEQHNDCTIIFDEISQMDPNDLGPAIYMIADGQGKARGKGPGGLRPKATWRNMVLSSGELTPSQHMETVGKKIKGGQEVRLISIPTEITPGSSLENLHEFEDGHGLSGWVKTHAAQSYGTAGRAWLEHLVKSTEGLSAELSKRMESIMFTMCPEFAVGQVQRGAMRFALVAAAGELATEAGLTGWPAGEATQAATTCFNAWLESRGGIGSSEDTAILRIVKGYIEQHGNARFSVWGVKDDANKPKTINALGVRREVNSKGNPVKAVKADIGSGEWDPESHNEETSQDYYFFANTFKTEVCKGFDYKAVGDVLLKHGCLIPEKGQRYMCKPRVPSMGTAWCFRVNSSLLSADV